MKILTEDHRTVERSLPLKYKQAVNHFSRFLLVNLYWFVVLHTVYVVFGKQVPSKFPPSLELLSRTSGSRKDLELFTLSRLPGILGIRFDIPVLLHTKNIFLIPSVGPKSLSKSSPLKVVPRTTKDWTVHIGTNIVNRIPF